MDSTVGPNDATQDEDPADLVAAVNRLSGQLRGIRRRNRVQTLGLIALAIVALVSGLGAIKAWTASDDATAASHAAKANADRIASVAHANYQTCLANNNTRADTRGLWDAIIATIAPLSTSAQGKQFIVDLRHDVEVATAPRVCQTA